MKASKLRIPLFVALCLAEVAFLFSASVAFAHAPSSFENAELSLFAASMKGSAQDCYFNLDIQGGTIRSICDTIFQHSYSENFSTSSTRVLAISSESGVASFEASFDGNQLPFTPSITSGKNYTNSEELVRMETVCINLFEYRNRREEHEYDPAVFDGFIYIPDYYADYILEHYLPHMGYHELIANSANYPFAITMNGHSFSYRIANIFHVRGFQQQYAGDRELTYNDYGTGAKLDRFFNGFCFASNYGNFGELAQDLHITLLHHIDPKKFLLEDNLRIGATYANEYQADFTKCDVYSFDGKQIHAYDRSTQLTEAFFSNSGRYEIGFIVMAGGFLLLFLVGLFAVIKGQIGFKHRSKSLLLLSGITTGYLLVSFCLKTWVPLNPSFQLFFNVPTLIAASALLIILLALLFFKRRQRSEM